MSTDSEPKSRADAALDGKAAEGLVMLARVMGRAEGYQHGRQATLAKLMELRFGPLTPATRALVEAADDDTLDRWTERILIVASLEVLLAS
jgi:hypothetical protein